MLRDGAEEQEENILESDEDNISIYSDSSSSVDMPIQHFHKICGKENLTIHEIGPFDENDENIQEHFDNHYEKFNPFNVALPLHHKIICACANNNEDVNYKVEDIENHTSWDPVYLVQGMVTRAFDFQIADFYYIEEKKVKKKVNSQK